MNPLKNLKIKEMIIPNIPYLIKENLSVYRQMIRNLVKYK